jgi:hypothetical protein
MDHGQLSMVADKFQWVFSEALLNACGTAAKFCRRRRTITPFRLGLALTATCARQRVETLADFHRGFNALFDTTITPTVCLDVIALVASCCGHYRGQIEQRAAHEFAVHVATLRRARETSTAPPAAARSARCVQAGAALQRSTAAPEAWHRSGTLSRSGTPRGRTREEKRPNRFTFLVMHRPPADAIFVSQPWPRYHWMLVRSS